MTKKQYRDQIAKLIRGVREIPDEAIRLIDKAVGEYPNESTFWHQRGHLIQLGSDATPHTLEDALASYFAALRLDPENPEILYDIAHFFDVVMEDELEAKKWFSKVQQITKRPTTKVHRTAPFGRGR